MKEGLVPVTPQVGVGRRILCVHQGVELYGSDRSFLQAVAAFRARWPRSEITVQLPGNGPLNALVAQYADTVVVRHLCVLRLAHFGQTLLDMTVALPLHLARAMADMRGKDLVYVNTSVLAAHMLAARAFPRRTVLHVREIPRRRLMTVIRGLCRLSGAHVIFNSEATREAFDLPRSQPQAVVYNGVDPVVPPPPLALPDRFDAVRPLRIAMLGRVNSWKGQDILVEALARFAPADRRRLQVRIVGGAFGPGAALVAALRTQVAELDLSEVVKLEDFCDDPGGVYRWADLCVVPSKRPEPFGRVAIEAMGSRRPVIASAHGGLVEIVEDPATGWLIAPNDPAALAAAIGRALDDPSTVAARADAGYVRALETFTTAAMAKRLLGTIEAWVPALARRQHRLPQGAGASAIARKRQ